MKPNCLVEEEILVDGTGGEGIEILSGNFGGGD